MADTTAQPPLLDVFDRTYGRTPAVAARRLQWAKEARQGAADEGDTVRVSAITEQIEALKWVLAKHERCQRCGRPLKKPESIERGIGPECWGRAP